MYRMDVLLKEGRQIFSTRDLALLWQISSNNTLYTTIKRYLQKGILIPVQKGLYSTVPLSQLDPLFLGASFLKKYSYVSCEYVLSLRGLISQPVSLITFISSVSKKFTISGISYLSRKMDEKYLFNPAGIQKQNGVMVASLERAVSDMLYFRPNFHFDNRLALDWQKIKLVQKGVGYL